MESKKCIICGKAKPLTKYYAHKRMKDGHLNKCKSCCKAYIKEHTKKKKQDTEWAWKEKERCRLKAKRARELGKHNTCKNPDYIYSPIKRKATTAAQRLPCPDGHHKHHWSYNQEHWKDVIILSVKDHFRVHSYTIYDPERMMYRTIHGKLLGTRQEAEDYYKYILSLPDGTYPEK